MSGRWVCVECRREWTLDQLPTRWDESPDFRCPANGCSGTVVDMTTTSPDRVIARQQRTADAIVTGTPVRRMTTEEWLAERKRRHVKD